MKRNRFSEEQIIGNRPGWTLAARLAHPNRIRNHLYPTTGPGAALNGQLHASPRLPPGSAGPKQPPESTSRWIKDGGNVIWNAPYNGPHPNLTNSFCDTKCGILCYT